MDPTTPTTRVANARRGRDLLTKSLNHVLEDDLARFEEMEVVGRGAHGTATLVRDTRTQKKFVVKKIPLEGLSFEERDTAWAEARLLSRLNHPNILEYVASFIHQDSLHIVTAFCDGGDLAKLLHRRKLERRPLTEDEVLHYFVQLAMAVEYIHSKHIMHRDLKTGNVFLTRRAEVKLGDFGIATVLEDDQRSHTIIGTPHYLSPEVCLNKPYEFKSDIWSLGCVLYELCTFEHPFDGQNILALAHKIVQGPTPPLPERFSRELRHLCGKLLSKDPNERPSAQSVFGAKIIRAKLERMASGGESLLLDASSSSLSPSPRASLGSANGGALSSSSSPRESRFVSPATASSSSRGVVPSASAAAASPTRARSASGSSLDELWDFDDLGNASPRAAKGSRAPSAPPSFAGVRPSAGDRKTHAPVRPSSLRVESVGSLAADGSAVPTSVARPPRAPRGDSTTDSEEEDADAVVGFDESGVFRAGSSSAPPANGAVLVAVAKTGRRSVSGDANGPATSSSSSLRMA